MVLPLAQCRNAGRMIIARRFERRESEDKRISPRRGRLNFLAEQMAWYTNFWFGPGKVTQLVTNYLAYPGNCGYCFQTAPCFTSVFAKGNDGRIPFRRTER